MGQLIDITGNKYGRLTVIKRDGKSKDHQAMWLCECECGNQVRVRSKDLRNGHTTSCGCYNRELVSSQIAGQKFNMLTALTPIGKDNNGNIIWDCICDCGNHINVTAKSLKQNHRISCGCNNRSQGEIYVKQYLNKLDILFESEYKFPDLKDNKPLRFDFAIFNNEKVIACIEIQGSQHYNSNDGYYKPIMIKHDEMKIKYCNMNNIPLLLLDYSKGYVGTNFNDWDNEILNFLKEVKYD